MPQRQAATTEDAELGPRKRKREAEELNERLSAVGEDEDDDGGSEEEDSGEEESGEDDSEDGEDAEDGESDGDEEDDGEEKSEDASSVAPNAAEDEIARGDSSRRSVRRVARTSYSEAVHGDGEESPRQSKRRRVGSAADADWESGDDDGGGPRRAKGKAKGRKEKKGGGAKGTSTAKLVRCGACAGCVARECGECAACLDMPKFGGPGRKRQKCVLRRSAAPAYS